jgi:hypothetical protein
MTAWDRQREVLAMLLEREPNVGWQLLSNLLPKGHDSSTSRRGPTWRDWAPDEPVRITADEYARRVRGIIAMMVEAVGGNGQRWTSLIDALPYLSADVHQLVVQTLRDLHDDAVAADDRAAI